MADNAIHDQLMELKDDIATVTAMLDQAQAFFDKHKHLLSEKEAWHQQALIDTARFDVEAKKLLIAMVEASI